MMNASAISAVLISLVVAGVLSPTPDNPHQNLNDNPNLIVKEGHRVVVVEYEKEDGSTKVVISPDGKDVGSYIHAAEEKISEAAFNVKDKVEDAASDVKGKVTESASEVKDKVKDVASGPRELICDAFGKCKHRIASALGKTKDKVSETVHEASELKEKNKDKVSEKVHEVGENVEEAYEKAKDVSKAVVDKTHEGIGKAKDMGESAKEVILDTVVKAKDFDVIDSPKRIEEDVRHNVSTIDTEYVPKELKEKAKKTGEAIEEKAKQAAKVMERSEKEGLKRILNLGREFGYNFIWYILPFKRLDSVVDVIHLMGISCAYGMCLFVTFVSSYVLSRALTKQQFGMVQSRLYPVYHQGLTVCVGLGLLGHLLGQRRRVLSDKLEMFQALNLVAALATVVGNSVFLEPRASKLMFERMKFDKEEGKGRTGDPSGGVAGGFGDPLCISSAVGAVNTREEPGERQQIVRMTERLKKLNMYSSFLNMMTLILLSWHIVYLGRRLQLTR